MLVPDFIWTNLKQMGAVLQEIHKISLSDLTEWAEKFA